MNQGLSSDRRFVVSYMFLRKAIGVLGVALPFALALGGLFIFDLDVQDSISHYYHTGMGDVFVGTLCAIAVFLLSYKGPEPRDDRAGDFACLCAVGAALFPTTPIGESTQAQAIIGGIHFAFAALFFLTLAYFSLFLFTKTDPARAPTPRKLQRNRVYRVCGGLILLALVLIALYMNVPGAEEALGRLRPVFWLEAVAVVAFGLSWLTKGEAILEDKVPPT
jgi:hypothetical protein